MPQKKLKKRDKNEEDDAEVEFDLGETFDAAEDKEDDFELDLDSANYRGKKGQSGTRRPNK